MFNLFKAKKQDSSFRSQTPLSKDDGSSRSLTVKPTFEIKADFGGLNGWPADVSLVSYLPTQGLLCAGTENGAILVYGKGFQYYRPRSAGDTSSIKNILSVGADICLVVYFDNSLAVLRLPSLELLDTVKGNWLTNCDEFADIELSCIHVDEFAEKSQRSFVYVGTSLGDVYVIEISSTSGSIRICDYAITYKDVEIATPMRVAAIISDEKCLMIGYGNSNLINDEADRHSESSHSCPSSPRNEYPQRFSSFIGESPAPAASSKCMGAVVVYNMTKRRVRHSYTMTSGVNFLLMDATGDILYAVLRNGEMLSLTACSGKSLSFVVWSLSPFRENDDEYYDDDDDQVVKQIKFLPPQTSSNTNAAGCYFLLLNSNNVICLSPSEQQGKMSEITSFRPLEAEEISDIHIVPISSSKMTEAGKRDSFTSSSRAHPGLLLVTKKALSDEYIKSRRNQSSNKISVNTGILQYNLEPHRGCHLRTLLCPTGISNIPTVTAGATAIEVAVAIAVAITESTPPASAGKDGNVKATPDPRRIGLPFPKEDSLTCLSALPPCASSSSMAAVLLAAPTGALHRIPRESKKGDGLSPRMRTFSNKEDIFDDGKPEAGSEIVLTERDRNARRESNYLFDLVFLGQKNGSLSVWASSPSTSSRISSVKDFSSDSQGDGKAYYAVWRQIRTFSCVPMTEVRTNSAGFSPSSSPFNNSISLFFPAQPAGSLGSESVCVTSVCPDEGAGLFAAGTSDGDVTVWEVYQVDSAMGCVEHTARLNAVRAVDVAKSVYGDDVSPSAGLVFSWDEDEDSDDQEDDDDEDEEIFDDKAAVVYDVRKLNSTAINFKSQLMNQRESESKMENKSKSTQRIRAVSTPVSPVKKQDLKINLFKKDLDASNIESYDPSEYLRKNIPFIPDDVRIVFRTKVTGSVTSQLLISDCLIFVVGTSAGGVWISRGLGDKSMVQLDLSGMWKVSTKSPGSQSNNTEISVTKIVYSLYYSDFDASSGRDYPMPIPVVYVLFACGNIAVICLQTCTMVAYCLTEDSTEVTGLQSILKKRAKAVEAKSNKDNNQKDNRFCEYDSDNEDDATAPPKCAACTVTDASYIDIKRPQYTAAYSIKESTADGKDVLCFTFVALNSILESPTSPDSSSGKFNTARGDSSSQDRINIRSRSRSNSDVHSTSTGSTKGSSQCEDQSTAPKYVMVAVGTSLVTYDITKFCKLSPAIGRPKRSYSITSYTADQAESAPEANFTAVKSGVQSSQVISWSPFVAGQHFSYIDKSSRTPPSSCLTLVSAFGRMPTISVKERTKLFDEDLFQKCGNFKDASLSSPPSRDQKSGKNPYGEESLEKSVRIPFNSCLKAGILLPNGSAYLLQKNGLLLSYHFCDANTHEVQARLPSRLPKSISTILPSLSLYPSPEQELKVQNYQNSFRNKQASLFGVITTVHSGPADLTKLFLKSRERSYRKERYSPEKRNGRMSPSPLGNLDISKDENERYSKRIVETESEMCSGSPGKGNKMGLFSSQTANRDKGATTNARANTESVQSTMSEAMRSLEDRGEKLSRLNTHADDLSNGAHHFRDIVKQHKEELQKKATRWGL